MHNVPSLVSGAERCLLFVHPKDAASRGIADGEHALLESRVHRGSVRVRVTDEVTPGVVSLPHGWGHATAAPWQRVAGRRPGVSLNDWTDEAEVEGVVGQSILNGVAVQLEALGRAGDRVRAAIASPGQLSVWSDEACRELGAELWRKPPHFAQVGASRIAYRVVGEGPPLILIHGWPFSSFSFRRVLRALSARFTCILPDTPGLGETEWTDATDFRFAAQADTLSAFARGLGLTSYALLAFDTGATIARQLGLIDPARVRRLVLLNTEIPHHRPPFIELYQRLTRLPGGAFGMRAMLRSRVLRRSRMGFGGCFVDLALLDGEFQAGVVAPLLASPRRLEGARRYLLGIDWDLVDGLAERHRALTRPVLFVWGADDPTFPIERARSMTAQLPDCRGLVAIPRARLLVHEERPEEVARAALSFLVE